MKKLFYILLAIFILGCAGRKSRVDKKSSQTSESSEIKAITSKKVDSIIKKDTKIDNTVITNTNKAYWKYTAPIFNPLNTDSLYVFKPFWLIINGDSVDVSKLPHGSTLESGTEDTDKSEYFQKIINELKSKKSELESQLNAKSDSKSKIIEKTKEVEKQSIQWVLVGIAFMVGIFIIPSLKGLWNIVKSKFFI